MASLPDVSTTSDTVAQIVDNAVVLAMAVVPAAPVVWEQLKLKSLLTAKSLGPLVQTVYKLAGDAWELTKSSLRALAEALNKVISKHFGVKIGWAVDKDTFIEHFEDWMREALESVMVASQSMASTLLRALPLSEEKRALAEEYVSSLMFAVSAVLAKESAHAPLPTAAELRMKSVEMSASASADAPSTELQPKTYEIPEQFVKLVDGDFFSKAQTTHYSFPGKSRQMIWRRATRSLDSDERIGDVETLSQLIYCVMTVCIKASAEGRKLPPAKAKSLEKFTSDAAHFFLAQRPEGISKDEYLDRENKTFMTILVGFKGFKIVAETPKSLSGD